jgi:hypothetical protein
MSSAEISLFSTRDKLIWFKHKIATNTSDFTQGVEKIIISRDSIIIDSLR